MPYLAALFPFDSIILGCFFNSFIVLNCLVVLSCLCFLSNLIVLVTDKVQ